MSVKDAVKQQKSANKLSLKYFDYFEGHRKHQTKLVLPPDDNRDQRLCVLGAGNCYDIELPLLASRCREIHLVDIDRQAITRARARLPEALAKKVHLHAPVDISGANRQLSDWRDMKVTPEHMMDLPERAVNTLLETLPAPFDRVLSSCIVSQLLLVYRGVLGDAHPLFEAGAITLLVTHFRLLAALIGKTGQAWCVTDISANDIAPLSDFHPLNDGLAYLHQRCLNNQVYHYLAPELIAHIVQQDPLISAHAQYSGPLKAWLWQNGPQRTFLVYVSKLVSAGS